MSSPCSTMRCSTTILIMMTMTMTLTEAFLGPGVGPDFLQHLLAHGPGMPSGTWAAVLGGGGRMYYPSPGEWENLQKYHQI